MQILWLAKKSINGKYCQTNGQQHTSCTSIAYRFIHPTPSPGRNYDGSSLSSSKRFHLLNILRHVRHRVSIIANSINGSFIKNPCALASQRHVGLFLDMSRAHASSTSTASLPHFEVPETTVAHDGPLWANFYSHYPKTMLAPNSNEKE